MRWRAETRFTLSKSGNCLKNKAKAPPLEKGKAHLIDAFALSQAIPWSPIGTLSIFFLTPYWSLLEALLLQSPAPPVPGSQSGAHYIKITGTKQTF